MTNKISKYFSLNLTFEQKYKGQFCSAGGVCVPRAKCYYPTLPRQNQEWNKPWLQSEGQYSATQHQFTRELFCIGTFVVLMRLNKIWEK